MRRSNGGVIWLLLSGAAMGFALSLILASMLFLNYLIPVFILLVISGYLCARVIGRAGGEFSEKAKNYSILLEGFMFGVVFDLMRFRYDWVINIFKYIAIGSFFILISVVLKRNLGKYSEASPEDGPYLGLMRPSILYILAGLNLAITINTVTEAFMGSAYFIATLPLLALFAILVMIFAKADFDLLDDESGVWNQLFAGAALGFAYDLLLFRIILWQDLVKLFVVCLVFVITAIVIRMKAPTKLGVGEISLELEDKKSRKKSDSKSKVVGEITLASKKSASGDSKKSSSRKKRSG
ncbi:MAG TPA: hypothetical protein VMX55_00885 [candidate division Zixibacteria bacterium]|nr:hypothetical protein [candidate division Zixibacteria bacterium]